jgi:hypothetical protein
MLILLLLQPQMDEVVEYGRGLADGSAPGRDVSDLFFPPAVSLTALTFATILSVAKPWGRVRRERS